MTGLPRWTTKAKYARPSKPDITRALEKFTETLDDPSKALTYKQMRTVLGKLRHVGREELLPLKSRMAHVVRGTENLLPTSIYIAAGKTFDAEVAHPVTGSAFRSEITSVLDAKTRKCVAVAISLKENTIAVTEALRKTCVHHGIPAIFYADRGPGYKNKALDADAGGLMARLSITKMHSLPYSSQARGVVERFNGSVWNPLAKDFPTYLSSNMDRESKQRAHKVSRLELKDRGASRLLMDWKEFGDLVQREVEAYNDRPHRGLARYSETGTQRHMTPNEPWAVHCSQGFEAILVLPEEAGHGPPCHRSTGRPWCPISMAARSSRR